MMQGPWNDGCWDNGMLLVWLLLLAIVVALVVLVVRSFSSAGRTRQQHEPSSALSILDDRLARGEIDAKEYEQRRQLLLKR